MEIGKCPKCGSYNLIYGDLECEDEMIFFECNCEDCGFSGKEWYSIEFIEYTENKED